MTQKKLTPKQSLFVSEYTKDFNATQAAIRAGYSKKTARQIGEENLSKPDISLALSRSIAERAKEVKVDALWVLTEAVRQYAKADNVEDIRSALKALDTVGKHVDVQAFLEKREVKHTIERMDRAELDAYKRDLVERKEHLQDLH